MNRTHGHGSLHTFYECIIIPEDPFVCICPKIHVRVWFCSCACGCVDQPPHVFKQWHRKQEAKRLKEAHESRSVG